MFSFMRTFISVFTFFHSSIFISTLLSFYCLSFICSVFLFILSFGPLFLCQFLFVVISALFNFFSMFYYSSDILSISMCLKKSWRYHFKARYEMCIGNVCSKFANQHIRFVEIELEKFNERGLNVRLNL